MFTNTAEQNKIEEYFQFDSRNLLIEALAGCGKTHTIVNAVRLLPPNSKITFLAFNKHIQTELKLKLPNNVYCYTSHGLGRGGITRKYKDAELDEFKIDKIITTKAKKWDLSDFAYEEELELYLKSIKQLTSLCKLTLTTQKKKIPDLADKYNVPIFTDKDVNRVLSILETSINDKKTYDFDDMVFLPAVDPKIWLFPQDYVLVDECFPHNQYISTEIGKKKIGHLAKMFETGKTMPKVETFNEQTKSFEKKNIVKVWCNGERDIYEVVVGGKRKIKSTKNHKYLTLNGWKRLDELKFGDAILSNYSDQPYRGVLNEPQEDIFIGSMLGDGSLHNLSKNISRIRIIHGKEQKDYIEWKASFFNSNVELVEENGFANKIAYRFTSKGFYFDDKYKDVKNIIDNITLKSLAIAWMDDGNISSNYYSSRLYSCAESKEHSEYLSEKMEKMWKIKSQVKSELSSSTKKEYFWLLFNKENTERLSNLISQFIHPSMEYKICPKDRKNINQNAWNFDNNQYGCMIVTKEAKYIKTDNVYDMEVEDNHNFIITPQTYTKTVKAKDYGFIAHNCQDMNRAQQELIKKILKKDNKTGEIIGRLISVGDKHQCQPKGTKILMSDGTEKNIEDIKIGDLVVSYNRKEKGQFVGKYIRKVSDRLRNKAPKVEKISKRKINENLIKVSSNNKFSLYTSNHKVMVRFKKESLNKYVLYLMRKDIHYRIGIVKLWNGKNDFGAFRARQENADDFWILKTYDNKFDAYTDEQYYSLEYKIPQLIFNYRDQKGNINQTYINKFYNKINKEELLNNSNKLLNLFGRDIRYPFWSKENNNYFSRSHMFELHACNIIENDMQMIHFDDSNITLRTHGKTKRTNKIIRPTYHNIDGLSKEFYSDYVYSLKISKYELYVADGILTHNSIYGFSGSDSNSFEWFRKYPNTITLPLTTTFRCSKEVVKHANKIVPDLKAMENAPRGSVKNGDVLKEARSGDFVLCRKSLPLVKLFFQFLGQHKKAIIKGSDIGNSLIEIVKRKRNIDVLKANLKAELKDYAQRVKSTGVLNVKEHSGYSALEDKIMTLLFIAETCSDMIELKDKINSIFTDKIEGIVLSTVHKIKGLEADRVFIIKPDILPMQTAKAWEYQQEKNLEYVAITRARHELIYDHLWDDEKISLAELKNTLL